MPEEGEETQPIGWPYCPVTDTENIIYTRMWARAAELEKQGTVLTDADLSRLWDEELERVKEQLQQRRARSREQLRRFMGLR